VSRRRAHDRRRRPDAHRDELPQLVLGRDTANKLRTSALWGLRTRSRFMHDLASLTLPNAIARHAGEAAFAADAFNRLNDAKKQQIIVFLNSL
jgi:CxxC motif-containing protein (DUF1111 family)